MSLADDNLEWAVSRLPNLMFEVNGGPDEDLQQEALLGFCEAARDWNGGGLLNRLAPFESECDVTISPIAAYLPYCL